MLVTNSLTFLPETDMIIMIDDGKIIETGTYNQLIEKNGQFFKFIQNSFTNAKEEGDYMNGSVSEDRKKTVSIREQ